MQEHTHEAMTETDATGSRCGMAALVGRANVGKSSILNAVLGDKVSIVSPVAQTTRHTVRAIHSESRGQLVFLDTPGVHKASSPLGTLMNRAARASITGADAALLVLDPSTPPRDEDDGWMRKLAGDSLPLVVALNKQDLGAPYEPAYRDRWAHCTGGGWRKARWIPVSARTGAGLEDLLSALFAVMPVAPPLFPDDMLTDFPRRLAISDVIREKYLGVLRDELPHDLAVRVTDLAESETGWTVYADILINRPSQKGIVIGQKGRLLRKVKREAQKDLEAMFEQSVTVELWVKVEPGWMKNHWILRQLGYHA